jgi:hypothetical protein
MELVRTPEKKNKNQNCPPAPNKFVKNIDIFEEEEEEDEYDKVAKQFEETNFVICLKSCELDEVLTHEKDVIISHTFACYCWNNVRKREYYHMKSDKPITKRMVIQKLIDINFNTFCNHSFLEDIFMKTPAQIGLYFGS